MGWFDFGSNNEPQQKSVNPFNISGNSSNPAVFAQQGYEPSVWDKFQKVMNTSGANEVGNQIGQGFGQINPMNHDGIFGDVFSKDSMFGKMTPDGQTPGWLGGALGGLSAGIGAYTNFQNMQEAKQAGEFQRNAWNKNWDMQMQMAENNLGTSYDWNNAINGGMDQTREQYIDQRLGRNPEETV